ncbi:ATP-binding protein [Paraburkholderia caribensis]|uniref:ATP-binding protein n=1 Tax=Paraburkholderia caribensis TaxID=75105 RepID=UPI0031D2AAAD
MRYLHNIASSGRTQIMPRHRNAVGPAGGMIIIGPTGSGKSSTLDRFGAYIGDYARLHTSLCGLPCYWPQIPFIRMTAAGVYTKKQAARQIATIIGRHLNDSRVISTVERTADYDNHIAKLLNTYLVGFLIVEDIQLLSRMKNEVKWEILSFLIRLQENGIIVICVGTILLQTVLEAHRSETEKLRSLGTIWIRPAGKGNETRNLCIKMWQRQIGEHHVEMPDWLPEETGRFTAGLRRHVPELFVPLFKKMADDKLKKLSRDYFCSLAEVALSHIAPGVVIMNRAYQGKRVDSDELKKFEEYIDCDLYKRNVIHRNEVLNRYLKRRASRSKSVTGST